MQDAPYDQCGWMRPTAPSSLSLTSGGASAAAIRQKLPPPPLLPAATPPPHPPATPPTSPLLECLQALGLQRRPTPSTAPLLESLPALGVERMQAATQAHMDQVSASLADTAQRMERLGWHAAPAQTHLPAGPPTHVCTPGPIAIVRTVQQHQAYARMRAENAARRSRITSRLQTAARLEELEREQAREQRAERERLRWLSLMAQREASRRRAGPQETARQRRRASVVLGKLAEQEMTWQYIQGAVVMLQAYARGLLARARTARVRGMVNEVRIQGQLCALQAAWKAREMARNARPSPVYSRGLAGLANVQRRLALARESAGIPRRITV
ncbi:hypothetical protein AB1Y20_009832 [Prymnesium parvum]|uniref:Uncharacterized protein n=1 Tax=Prymnesium parvum TaxID=97485 RepID=A0AB34K7P0_PRYPA